MENSTIKRAREVSEFKLYKNQELIHTWDVDYIGQTFDGRLAFQVGDDNILIIDSNQFPLSVWKYGDEGQIKMKSKLV